MIAVEHIEAWRGQQVVDPAGEQLGKLEEVYFDSASGTPVLIAVRSGLLGRRSKYVPIDGATVGPDFVRVVHDKETIDRTTDSAGDRAPSGEELGSLGTIYRLKFAERLKLEGAGELEARRAEAQAARARAEELAGAARERAAERDAAHQRAQGAGEEAERAAREAQEADRAALKAREDAARYERD